MNETWQLFIFGFLVGAVALGFVVYEYEENRYLSLENSYKDAVTKAQNKVIQQDNASATANSKLGAEYANRINDAINAYRTGRLQPADSNSLPVLPKTPSRTPPAACDARQVTKLKTQVQLRDIQINELQKFYNNVCTIYSCQ